MAKKTFPPHYQQRISPSKMKTRMMTQSEINKIKDEATQKAVTILEEKYNVDKIKEEAYKEAIVDAHQYFILCSCKVLHEVFGFGYKRLERFIEQVAELEVDTQDGTTTLEVLQRWLDEHIGMKLVSEDIDDAIKKRQEE